MDTKTDLSQCRGDLGAYERYLRGMDVSMRQKIALTAAHLLGEGRVADMGMGSGKGSHALASLYPRLQVTGVDLDPNMVAMAREHYRLPNLDFQAGNIAEPVFEPGSMVGIFNSSVLHHVTSFGGYERAAALKALETQVPQLREGGVLIVRDFLDPGPGEVRLEVPACDGDDSDDPRNCSTAKLLERFSKEFRSLHEAPGFELLELEALQDTPAGWRSFSLSAMHAVEFVLRKDYRADWEDEVREEYTYLSQAEFERGFQQLGLRVLASTPIRNPWILRHRFEGQFRWKTLEGEALEWPATNYLIVGERAKKSEGVRFDASLCLEKPSFLVLEHYRHRASGQVFDLVRRRFKTLDVVPFFEEQGELYVLARMAYPRPLLAQAPTLDGSRSGGYITEPLNLLQTDRPLGQTLEECLRHDAGIEPHQIREVFEGSTYYPSPGGILEEITSVLVEVEPRFVEEDLSPRSGFSTSGRVGAISAPQILRAAQVGGLPDARLELNVYDLLRRRGSGCGPWIGEVLSLKPCEQPPVLSESLHSSWDSGRAFESVSLGKTSNFMEINCMEFQEFDSSDAPISSQRLEYAVPRTYGINTLSVAALLRHEDRIYMGVACEDLPAAQAFRGHSNLAVTPAWRLPRDIDSLSSARNWVRARMEREYGLVCGEAWELGGRYHPSPGLTPEAVFPVAFEVMEVKSAAHVLRWVPLELLASQAESLLDGHLRIACLRAAHALGLL